MNASIVIRSDASSTIGFGHIMRCLALAQAWQDAGGNAVFVSSQMPSTLSKRLKKENVTVIPVLLGQSVGSDSDARKLIEIARNQQASWVVVDGYVFGSDYLKKIKDAGFKLLWIDDTGCDVPLESDLIVNQNIYAQPSIYPYPSTQTTLLLGTEYILLRREFRQWKGWERKYPSKADRILVTLGGSDTYKTMDKIIQAIDLVEVPSLHVRFVVGSHMTDLDKLKEKLHHSSFSSRLEYDVDNMSKLMAWADLAISAAGSTTWEMAFMGLPRLVIVLAENQLQNALYLEKQGISVYLGSDQNIEISSTQCIISQIITDPQQRTRMGHRSRRLVCGDGASRIVNKMLSKDSS